MRILIFILLLLIQVNGHSQQLHFTVRMDDPASHYFQVELSCSGVKGTVTEFKLPVWTPGYYQRLDL